MIEIDSELLDKIKKELEGITDGIETVVSKVSNKTAQRAKRYIIDRIIEDFYINKNKVNSGISMRKAGGQHTIAELTNNRKKDHFGLQNFRVDVPNNGPIKIGLRKSGGLVDLRRAFLQDPKNQPGNIMVFRRRSNDPRFRKSIERQYGYSFGGMMEHNPKLIKEWINQELDEELEIQLNNFFEK
ncbi:MULTISPECIES: hypothetical protein [Psychrilyobacter]|uniref:HK97 gp10 family phage protein n=1 Tax=Psychrilyobacter piezotolerans TaxID=2293438 RepID=A0ABX9KJP4_9FUSO|nr:MULTISPECIES: hypothetical protein [Psychrilyobacter]MCS5421254.1 hypothetical protein [Psychrilyobacter sp. S5]NDI76989.1 hypothetical protein [Psychrilyobacter piezotolerans]RDE64606.1 hypothetical protein DV867_03435 [Psychrilyobacter sp. S5]REI42418.1 hypothetical protein DYH56_03435 [Psychrilyobacter piezotolerans]